MTTPLEPPLYLVDDINLIQQHYLTYYGRPADPVGLQFWIHADLSSRELLTQAFVTSQEYEGKYMNLSNSDLINNLYQQLFGRVPDISGMQFYIDLLDKGEATFIDIATRVTDGVLKGSPDELAIDNRLAVANAITAMLINLGPVKYNEYKYGGENSADKFAIDDYFSSITSDTITRDEHLSKDALIDLMVALGVLPDTVPPIFTSPLMATILENSPINTVVYDAQANDNVGRMEDNITYNLNGIDALSFTINQANGVVKFISSPNYEIQNIYSIDVIATDSSDNAASLTVTVSVIDVYEPPPQLSVTINGTYGMSSILTAVVGGNENMPITYQWYRDNIPIGDATNETYTLNLADQGTDISLQAHSNGISGFDSVNIFKLEYSWNSITSILTVSTTTSSATMESVTVVDKDGNDITIGNPSITLNDLNGTIVVDLSDEGLLGTTNTYEDWSFTFTNSDGVSLTETYDIVISSEKDLRTTPDAEIILLRPWDETDTVEITSDRNIWTGGGGGNDHGINDKGDLIFIPLTKDIVDYSQFAIITLGSHIEGNPNVSTYVSFDSFADPTRIKLTMSEPGDVSIAEVYNDDGTQVGTVSMTYVSGILVNDGNNEVTGNSVENLFTSYSGDGDVFYGMGGDDSTAGGIGNTTFDGGEGSDWYIFTYDGYGLTLDLSTIESDGFSHAIIGTTIDYLISVENIVGTEAIDSITGDDKNNILAGWKGADTLIGNGGDDILMIGDGSVAKVDGGDGDDTLWFNYIAHGQGDFEHGFYEVPDGMGGNIVFSNLSGEFSNIEIINIGNILDTVHRQDVSQRIYEKNGDNNLTLSYEDIANMTDNDNILYIVGDDGDGVTFVGNGNWVKDDQDFDGYDQYSNDGNGNALLIVYVENDLFVL